MRRSYAFRLAAAFSGIGIAAAALTAILVNVSFGTRFTSYLEDQQRGPPPRLPVRVDGEVVGTAIVRLPQAWLLPQDVSFRSSVNRLLLLGGILAGLAALVLGIVLGRRATAPARALPRTAPAPAAR